MENSKIEWTHHTANLWIGCTEVHEGCDNCYARVLNHRWGHENWGKDAPRRAVKKVWGDFVKWQKEAKAANRIDRVFVGSMMDIFEKPMPVINSKGELQPYKTDILRNEFFLNIVPACPNLTFLLLTKRPGNINRFIPESWKASPPANVIFGTSPVNQQTFRKLVGELCEVNGRRFLSVEPQLEIITLEYLGKIDWIIQGGESGHNKRPFNLDWAYSLKHECESANIPYFFKQIDKIQAIPEDLMVRQFPA